MTRRISAADYRRLYGAPPVEERTDALGRPLSFIIDPDPASTRVRAAAGTKARTAGVVFEGSLAGLHDLYRAQGRADIRRRPHETRQTREGVVNLAKTGADFAGVLAGGRAVSMEAKTLAAGGVNGVSLTGVASWPSAELDELRSVATLGGLAVIVCDVRAGAWAGRYVVTVTGSEWNPDNAPIRFAGFGGERVDPMARECNGTDWLAAAGFPRVGS